MTWSEYVARISGDDQGRDFQAKTGIDGSTLSRWRRGKSTGLRADTVAAFARGYRVPVLEAFVEAGFISPEEAAVRPAGKPDLNAISNAELVELVRQRLEQRAGGEHAELRSSAPITQGPGGAGKGRKPPTSRDDYVAELERLRASPEERERLLAMWDSAHGQQPPGERAASGGA